MARECHGVPLAGCVLLAVLSRPNEPHPQASALGLRWRNNPSSAVPSAFGARRRLLRAPHRAPCGARQVPGGEFALIGRPKREQSRRAPEKKLYYLQEGLTLFILPRKEREVPQNTTTLRPGRAGAVGRRNETPLAKFENALHKGNSGTGEARKMHSIGFFRVKEEAVSRVKDARRIHCNT